MYDNFYKLRTDYDISWFYNCPTVLKLAQPIIIMHDYLDDFQLECLVVVVGPTMCLVFSGP